MGRRDDMPVGVKFSIRSCSKETRADELASYIARNIGSGGGHTEKSGGVFFGITYDIYIPAAGQICCKYEVLQEAEKKMD